MYPWFQIVTLMVLVALSLGHTIPRPGVGCTSLNRRKSWNDLTNLEKAEYIRAERCLMSHPPVVGTTEGAQNLWDELQWTHIWQGNYIHFVGHFLPWHRYLIRTHELLLQTLCGYTGAQPYWDEVTDYESGPLHESSVFDPVFGVGGNGFGEEGCIRDGPFRDTILHLKAGGDNEDYCISRRFDQTTFGWANRSNIEACHALSKYTEAWVCYNTYPHSAGHAALGGVMFDTIYSNGDPIFYLHHAYVDRMWWQWQQADLANRLTEIGGPNVPSQEVLQSVGLPPPSSTLVDYNGDEGDTTTLAHVLWMHGIRPNVTIAEVMDLGGGVICAEYF
ncbi:hypothetical protein BDW59DRAFT_167458 [Aspergillus cavernicola]|uniref:Tyrosinase copper-binding domain-containing protein n=1 Tax=Aspergillus cavernicola TaxID=176166 RepID=A0ABR4HDU1_9EURO